MGIPMSVVISPLVYGALLVGNDLVNLLIPTPDLFYLLAHSDQNPAVQRISNSTGVLIPVLALVVPGMVVMALAWGVAMPVLVWLAKDQRIQEESA